ncbi:hypothetical protein [Peribacillus frigoritolerans]|uniref:hypothetical protein n=1 Tax=Peribacillus frigoritolerans TaxID=450367 RepID=UPI0007BF0BF6|nr:hypothetical protein [Peribacillus frigoritolerans]
MKDKLVLNRVRSKTSQHFFKLIGKEGTRILREKRGRGDPAGVPRRLPPARGKRVPGVEINVPILQT